MPTCRVSHEPHPGEARQNDSRSQLEAQLGRSIVLIPESDLMGVAGQVSLRVMTLVIIEQHFSGSDDVRDVVIGMSNELKVPFALTAGISGALTFTHIWNYLRA